MVYYYFHKSHNYTINKCIKLKDAIDVVDVMTNGGKASSGEK